MTRFVDRDAGFAIFTQGRSLCIRLDGELDGRMARGIEERIRADHENVRLRLECSTLERVDPDALRSLAGALLAWSQWGTDRSIDILNLDPSVATAVTWHPLRPFLDSDELVFIDPDRDEVWAGVTPSRH